MFENILQASRLVICVALKGGSADNSMVGYNAIRS